MYCWCIFDGFAKIPLNLWSFKRALCIFIYINFLTIILCAYSALINNVVYYVFKYLVYYRFTVGLVAMIFTRRTNEFTWQPEEAKLIFIEKKKNWLKCLY